MGAVRVGVARSVKTRTVRLGFANLSWVVAGPTKTRVAKQGW